MRSIRLLVALAAALLASSLSDTVSSQATSDLLTRAQAHVARGDLGAALALALRAHVAEPGETEPLHLAAILYYRLGAVDAAEATLQRVAQPNAMTRELARLVQDRRRFDSYLAAAEQLLAAGAVVDAAENLVNAWRVFPGRHDIAVRAAGLYADAHQCRTVATLTAFLATSPSEDVRARATALGQRPCSTQEGHANLRFETCDPGMVLRPSGCQCAIALPRRLDGSAGCTGCPTATVFTGTRCECASTAVRRGDSCSCPATNPAWSPAVGACMPCGAGGAWDSAVCSCPAATAWNGQTCACTEEGHAWDGSACVPRAQCALGATCGCPAGRTWNGESCACARGMIELNQQCVVPRAAGAEEVR